MPNAIEPAVTGEYSRPVHDGGGVGYHPHADLRLARMKLRYQIDLDHPSSAGAHGQVGEGLGVRTVELGDLEVLARLMLEAYIGTIDYEGEGVDEAVDEVRSFFEGTPMLDHSYLATLDGEVASAVLVLVSEGEPFIGYVMTHPAHKGRGVARHLVRNAMASLKDDGWRRVILYITQGNAPSEALFRSVGALQVAED